MRRDNEGSGGDITGVSPHQATLQRGTERVHSEGTAGGSGEGAERETPAGQQHASLRRTQAEAQDSRPRPCFTFSEGFLCTESPPFLLPDIFVNCIPIPGVAAQVWCVAEEACIVLCCRTAASPPSDPPVKVIYYGNRTHFDNGTALSSVSLFFSEGR